MLLSWSAVLLTAIASEESRTQEEAAKVRILVGLDLSDLGEEDPAAPEPFRPSSRNFLGDLRRIRELSKDPEVAGLRLVLGEGLDFARTLDLLSALHSFRSVGKRVFCFAESLDAPSCMVASAADFLAVPPSGQILLEGPSIEAIYLKELLAKVGVEFEVLHVGEYKTAFEEFSRDRMSAEQRESLTAILQEFYAQLLDTIGSQRGLSRETVESLFEKVFITPQEALQARLIDAVLYEDEFNQRLEEQVQGEVEIDFDYGDPQAPDLMSMFSNPFAMIAELQKLIEPSEDDLPEGPKVAIVYATGPIESGESARGFGGSLSMGSETIALALDQTYEDDEVKAVVLRVNSPGGSALASDMIWRAVQRVRTRKPVIASMGDVAASGGYWILMGCDRILAQPSTITGSLGVVGAVPNLSQVLAKLGVHVEIVGAGPRTEDLAILGKGLSPFLRENLTRLMQDVYDEFIRKAAAGRKMDPGVVEPIARGRVWTGRDAERLGLVDGLGGMEEAIALACAMGGGLSARLTPLVELPKAPGLLEALEETMGRISMQGLTLQSLRELGWSQASAALAAILRHPHERVHCTLPFLMKLR